MKKEKVAIEFGVYSISYQDKILYIGSTNNFKLRKNAHLKKIRSGTHIKSLQKFVDENVKDLNELEIKIIHITENDNKLRLFMAEMVLIQYYHPLNRSVIQLGLKYVQFPHTDWDLKILDYL